MTVVEREHSDIVEVKHRKKHRYASERRHRGYRHDRWVRDSRKKDRYGRNLGGRWRSEPNSQRIWIPGTGR